MLREDVLSIAWWNTGLSPRAKPRKPGAALSEAQLKRMWAQAEQVVRTLADDLRIDVLALGEVTRDDVGRLRGACSIPLQEIVDPGVSARTTDIGLLFNPMKAGLVIHNYPITSIHGRAISLGLQVAFKLDQASPLLHLYVAHWPSRLQEEGAKLRERVASDTRHDLKELLPDGGVKRPYVVVMGDLNAEPFESEVTGGLGSTRDRERSKTRAGLLYNPFWRLLGERQSVERERSEKRRKGAGTYFHAPQMTDRWRTFDQILVSPSLLGGEGWALWEDKVDVWQGPPLLNDDGRLLTPFDHFPIVGALRREAPTETQ